MRFEARHRVIPAVYVLFRKNDEVLLLKRATTGYFDGYYSLPAGHVDGGEPAVRAAIREAKEEVGVKVKAQELTLVHVLHRVSDQPVHHERIDLFFEASQWQGKLVNCEPHKCDELRWSSLSHLPDNTVPEVKHVLEAIAAGKIYSDYNFERG